MAVLKIFNVESEFSLRMIFQKKNYLSLEIEEAAGKILTPSEQKIGKRYYQFSIT